MIAMHNVKAPATTEEIKMLLAPVSDIALLEIRRIGPTLSEVKEARAFMESDDYVGEAFEKNLDPRPRRVYMILKQERCAKKACCCS